MSMFTGVSRALGLAAGGASGVLSTAARMGYRGMRSMNLPRNLSRIAARAIPGMGYGALTGGVYGTFSDRESILGGAFKGALLGGAGGALWNRYGRNLWNSYGKNMFKNTTINSNKPVNKINTTISKVFDDAVISPPPMVFDDASYGGRNLNSLTKKSWAQIEAIKHRISMNQSGLGGYSNFAYSSMASGLGRRSSAYNAFRRRAI